jgi:aldehyde:ferredoxin oxidoreductase
VLFRSVLKVGGDVNALKPEGQVDISRALQIATAAIDSTGMCLFVAFAILDQPETFQAMLDMISAFSGTNMTGDGVTELGKKVLTMERDFNKAAGFTPQHDRLPSYFKTEKFAPHNVVFAVKDEDLDKVFNW